MKQATTPEECVLERLSLPHCACDLVCDLTPFWLMQLKLNQWGKKCTCLKVRVAFMKHN